MIDDIQSRIVGVGVIFYFMKDIFFKLVFVFALFLYLYFCISILDKLVQILG